MKIMVTGAAGFVGSSLSEALIAAGHDVVGVDCFIPYYDRSIKESNLAGLRTSESFDFREVDLRTDDLASAVDGIEAVVHLAAMPGLAKSWTDVELYSSCNIVATARLVDAVRGQNLHKFVHISTSSVYGSEANGDERMPLCPASPYGVTKLAAEHLVLANANQFGLPGVILRYFSIYGPRQRPDMGYNLFCEALLDDRPITIFGDGSATRSNTYIDDCVRGTMLGLQHGHIGEAYNIGGGEVIGLLDAINVIAEQAGVAPKLIFGDKRPGDQKSTQADCSKAGEHLGYQATVGPHEGLARQFAWHLARRG